MSEMKHYEGTYSYTGKFKHLDDGTNLLEVTEFEYYGKFYQPFEPLKFKITPRPEEGGWLSVTEESIGVCIGGVDFEEALGNAMMDAALLYEHLMFTDSPLEKNAAVVRDKFKHWVVHAIDSKAQPFYQSRIKRLWR